jgi:hypothetical protein
MDQLFDIAAGYARVLQHVRDTTEDRLGVVGARRQNLAGYKASILGDQYEVGKGAADIDAEATRRISIHGLLLTHGFGFSLDIARNSNLRHMNRRSLDGEIPR